MNKSFFKSCLTDYLFIVLKIGLLLKNSYDESGVSLTGTITVAKTLPLYQIIILERVKALYKVTRNAYIHIK